MLHLFKPDLERPEVCREAFGGVARCSLPMDNPIHVPNDQPPDEWAAKLRAEREGRVEE